MYTISRLNGVVIGVDSAAGHHPKGTSRWQDFLEWNAKQPTPLDLSDKPALLPSPDPGIARIQEIATKKDADITAAEVKELVLRFVRKRLNG